ncbi:hypothetical protein Tco_0531745 [Tanacetum coccineum]
MAFNTVSICWPSALVVVGNRLQNLGQILGLESLKFGSNLLDLMIVKDFEEGVLYLRCTTYLDSSVREDDVFNKGWLRRSSHEISGGRVDHTIDSLRNSSVKRALFTTPILAKSKNLGATSVVAKSRLSVAKTTTTTNKTAVMAQVAAGRQLP